MPLRPYDVSKPFLMGDADPAIMDFAREKFAAMAKRAISRMQRVDASGVFRGEAGGLRSLWDEWCWYQANHDSDTALLSDAIEQTVDGFISSVVEELPRTEAILLTKAAAEEEGEFVGGYDPSMIAGVVREVVCEAASRRNMSRFEVY